MAFSVGQEIGPYKIISPLGQGGMASVYKAYHASLDRYVAIKVMHVNLNADETFIERFKREAQIVAKLEHPHIIPVYDFAQHNAQPFLVMKFVEGRTLKQRLRQSILSLQEITHYVTAIASALDYAHQRDVLHRDVKPSNVMLDDANVPYLTDFGLARIASSGESTISQDVMVGTPHYISPEQARGGIKLDNRADVYSLGVMLYELVVGRVPFTADTPFTIVHDHIYKPVPPPCLVNPSVTPQVEAVLLRALAKDRDERYSSAGAMTRDFKIAVEASEAREMSASFLRPEIFEDLADGHYVNVTPPTLGTKPTPPATPVYPSPQMMTPTPMQVQWSSSVGTPTGVLVPSSSSFQRKKTKHSNQFWLISGTLVFLCGCIFSALGTLGAFNDDTIIASDVQDVEGLPTPNVIAADESEFSRDPSLSNSQTPDPHQLIESEITAMLERGITVAEAEALVDLYPNDPMVLLVLSLAYLEEDNYERSLEILHGTFLLYDDITADDLMEAASILQLRDFPEEALLFYMRAFAVNLESDATDMTVRNDVGKLMYETANQGDVEAFCYAVTELPLAIPLRAFLLQAMIVSGLETTPSNCGQLSNMDIASIMPLELSDRSEFPEGRLIIGNYYASVGDMEKAVALWRPLAESSPLIPEWVTAEAQRQLPQTPPPVTTDMEIFDEIARNGITIAEAEQLIAENPEDPAAYMALSLAYLEAGDIEKAGEIANQTFTDFNVDAEMMTAVADVLVQRGYSDEAIQFYMLAIILDPQNREVRDRASNYIYSQAVRATENDIVLACDIFEDIGTNPFTQIFYAQVLISAFDDPSTVNVSEYCASVRDDSSIEAYLMTLVDENMMPEAYLILANYYDKLERFSLAANIWRGLADNQLTPEWIRGLSQDKLRIYEERFTESDIDFFDLALHGEFNVEEAEAYRDEYPDNPYTLLMVLLANIEAENRNESQQLTTEVIEKYGSDVKFMLDMATILDGRGHESQAITAHIYILGQNIDNLEVRAVSGQYLFDAATNSGRTEIVTFCSIVSNSPNQPYWNVFLAQAIISNTPRVLAVPVSCRGGLVGTPVRDLIDAVPADYPEKQLVLGNFYEVRNQASLATQTWGEAVDQDDIPWVKDLAQQKLDAQD